MLTAISQFPARLLAKHPRILREGFWVGLGQVLVALGTLLGTRITMEFVDPEVFGAVLLMVGVMLLGRNFLCQPILSAMLRYFPDYHSTNRLHQLRRAAARILTANTTAVALLLIIGGAIYSAKTQLSHLVFPILAITLVFDIARNLEAHLFAYRQKPVSIAATIEAWARPALAIVAVLLLGPSPQAVLSGYFGGTVLAWVYTRFFVERVGLSPNPIVIDPPTEVGRDTSELDVFAQALDEKPTNGSESLSRQLWSYAIPLMPLAIVAWITNLSNRYIIAGLLDDHQTGLYGATFGLMSQPFLLVQGIITRTLSPVYFRAASERDAALERRTLRAAFISSLILCGGGFFLVLIFRKWLGVILLAEQYRAGIAFMPWIAGGYLLYTLGGAFELKFMAHKQTGRIFLTHTIVAVASIVLPLLLIPHLGVYGVAVACPLYFGLGLTVYALLSLRRKES